jgi:hypothetical protein
MVKDTSMIETMFILILYLKGSAIEYMGHYDVQGKWREMGMSGCLSMKRTLKRNGWRDSKVSNTRYSCEKRKVYIEKDKFGRMVVARIVE